MSELRQRLGSLVNLAAYGQERVVLVAHGEPKAALVSVTDLKRLQQLDAGLLPEPVESTSQALMAADLLRERIQQWQASQSMETEDVVTTLNRLRQEQSLEIGRAL